MNCRRETVKMDGPPGNRMGVGSEAYLNSTSQGPTPEDARKDGHVRGRSRRFMKNPGYVFFTVGMDISDLNSAVARLAQSEHNLRPPKAWLIFSVRLLT